MSNHNLCLELRSAIRDLQDFDSNYKKLGEAHPEFQSSWDDKTYSLIFTQFGRLPNPQWLASKKTSKPGLTAKFMGALEGRFCRRNYQSAMDLLEDILSDAIPRHGEDKVAQILKNQFYLLEANSIDRFKSIGLTMKNEAGLKHLFAQTKRIKDKELSKNASHPKRR